MSSYTLLGLVVKSVCVVYLMWLTAAICEDHTKWEIQLTTPEDKFAFCVMPCLTAVDIWLLVQEVKASMFATLL